MNHMYDNDTILDYESEYYDLCYYVRDIYDRNEYLPDTVIDKLLWIKAINQHYNDVFLEDIRTIFQLGETFSFDKIQYIKTVRKFLQKEYGEDKLTLKTAVHIVELYYL